MYSSRKSLYVDRTNREICPCRTSSQIWNEWLSVWTYLIKHSYLRRVYVEKNATSLLSETIMTHWTKILYLEVKSCVDRTQSRKKVKPAWWSVSEMALKLLQHEAIWECCWKAIYKSQGAMVHSLDSSVCFLCGGWVTCPECILLSHWVSWNWPEI